MTYNALLANREDSSPVEMSYEQRADHTYMVGITGKGKSTLMAQLALADMNHPDRPGLCVLDPHGTLVEDILTRVPEHRLDDVILIDPADPDFPFAFNLFAPMPDQVELDRYASELIGVFEATFGEEWRQVSDTMRNLTLTLLGRNSQANLPNTDVLAIPAMDEIPHLLNLERVPEGQEKRPFWNQERETYRALFYDGLQDAGLINVLEFWKRMYDQLTPRLKMGTVQRLVERMNRFLGNPLMARTLAQTENRLDFDEVLNDGRILLVNLSKSQLGEENSRFLGSVILARLTAAIFKRDPRRPDQIRRFHVIIDEFHNLITSSFPKLFTDGRKFGVDVVVAHQKRGENPWAERTTAAAGNLICFELHGGDQQEMAAEFDLAPPQAAPEYQPRYESYEDSVPFRDSFVIAKLGPAAIETLAALERSVPVNQVDIDALTTWLGAIRNEFNMIRENDAYLRREYDQVAKMLVGSDKTAEERERAREIEAGIREFHDALLNGTSAPPNQLVKSGLERMLQRYSWPQLDTFVQERVTYHNAPRSTSESYSAGSRGTESAGYSTSGEQSGPLYDRAPGRPRPYSDVQVEVANRLAHLGKYRAMFKLSNEEETNRVGTTLPLPEPTLSSSQLAMIRSRTRDQHCRPRAEVDKELLQRYQARLRSVGYADWETGKPLPDIPLYSSDDAEADDE